MCENAGRLAGRLMSAVIRNPVLSIARVAVGALLLVLIAPVTHASETITYTYDALGRLTSSSNSGGVNNGLQTNVSYDAAGNRSNYSMSGAPPPPSLSISNASVTEGGALVFTVTKSGTGPASASWTTANGSASSGSDYTAASGTISFAYNETSKTISIPTIDDAAVESAETLTVTLSNPSPGVTISSATGTGTISDNDVAAPNFAIYNSNAVAEGGTLQFTVLRTGSATTSYSVNFATADGTATSGSDYTAASGTLTFAANEGSKIISVVTIVDGVAEGAETVLVNLSGATGGATISSGQGSGTITASGTNAPPVAVRENAQITKCAPATAFNVLQNDYDPDGNTPLSINGIQYTGNRGTASFLGDNIYFTPNGTTGNAQIWYRARDTLGALSEPQALTLTIVSGSC